MKLTEPQDLFALNSNDSVTKRNLFDLIQYSKVEGSDFWAGERWNIANTPQQGINWIGAFPNVEGVVIKTRPGSYKDDGWSNKSKLAYKYSFKARNQVISFSEKANQVLIQQPLYGYPILLFTEDGSNWRFEGAFSVSEIAERFVVLHRGLAMPASELPDLEEETVFYEGGRRYVSHLMVERNRSVIRVLKKNNAWICDVCGLDFLDRYGVRYIEAHHKVPVSTYSSSQAVDTSDFVLLCPNCHKAVHAHMKREGLAYDAIKVLLTAGSNSVVSTNLESPNSL